MEKCLNEPFFVQLSTGLLNRVSLYLITLIQEVLNPMLYSLEFKALKPGINIMIVIGTNRDKSFSFLELISLCSYTYTMFVWM